MKNRNREKPTFANINLLGLCNANCFFCLGKDLPELKGKNQLKIHFSAWPNFLKFLRICEENNINKLFFTGQTADGLQYEYLDQAVIFLERRGFEVGLRSNGYLALNKMNTIQKMSGEIGYTINSLYPIFNSKIMKRKDIPEWSSIIPQTGDCRFSIVVNRYNVNHILKIIKYLSLYDEVKYIQLRRISTDNRHNELHIDQECYQSLLYDFSRIYEMVGEFHTSNAYLIHGKPCYFWETTATTVNSFNYFTDGTISTEYFIVEGYKNSKEAELSQK